MIWVIGSKGMLASDVIFAFRKASFSTICSDIETDITDINILRSFADKKNITHIVNCSAYTAVDDAEDNKALAYLINEKGVKNIALIAKELSVPMFHISTDYVFDGTLDVPLTEDMRTNPIGVYGASKLAGENEIRKNCPNHFILRTAWLYGKNGNNFVSTMIRLMNEKKSLSIIADQWGAPTWTVDLANVLVKIVSSKSTNYGTYNYSNNGRINWYGFATKIFELVTDRKIVTSGCRINAITTDQYPTKARRPSYSLLSKEKIIAVFNINIPSWEDSLKLFIEDISCTEN